MKFCPNCGNPISHKLIISEGNIPYCKNCDKVYFPHNAACIIALIIYNDQLLLVKQAELGDEYCLVSGHIKAQKSAEETLIAEIQEEVNLYVEEYSYLGSYYHEKSDHLMLGYVAKCTGNIQINEELYHYKLFNLEEAIKALSFRKCGRYFLEKAIKKELIK